MAQTAPPLPGEGMPRPLPRGGRPLRSRDTRPRFQVLDAVWMILLAALFVGLCFAARGHQPLSAACLATSAGAVILTYLLGWRASGRPAGVVAGLLLATSGTFTATSALSLPQDCVAFLTLAALFAFVAGSSLVALALAAALVWLRPDCALLGLLLLTITIVQHRKRAWIGALLFLAPSVAALTYLMVGRHGAILQAGRGFHPELWAWLAAPATLFVSWFLLLFFGEMADPVRRARWLPLVLWAALYAILASALTVGRSSVTPSLLVPFLPLWFLAAGVGLARLLPVMTGDLPIPVLRYVVATLAVLSLVAIRARAEWPVWTRHVTPPPASVVTMPAVAPVPAPHPAVRVAAPAAALPPAAVPARLMPAPKPTLHKPVVVPRPSAPPKQVKTAPVRRRGVKPAVRLYVLKNGRLVRRTRWAVQWDLTHPHS